MNPRLMRPYKEGVPASLLLRFDGTNGSTSFVDSSPNALTMSGFGAAEISTAQSKWGGSSAYFDGSALVTGGTSPLVAFGTGDFTVEAWVYVNAPVAYGAIFSSRASDHADDANSVFLALNDAAPLLYTDALVLQGSIAVANDTWTHIAWVRKDGVLTIYVDGVSAGSAPFTTDLTADNITVGGEADTSQAKYVGFIDDLRITPAAVYQGPFIPSAAPLSPYAKQVAVSRQASLLLHFDGANGSTTFTDSSVNAIAMTGGLDTELTTANFKYGTAAVALNSTSIVSDDTGIIPDMSAGDWTLEAWVWRPSGVSNAAILNLQAPGGGATGLHFWIGDDHQIRWDEGTQECAVGGSVPTEEWAHIAAVRFGGVTRLYLNGEQVGSESSIAPVAGPYTVFVGQHGGDDFFSDMLIDDLRIVRGLAVYQGPFTPPTGPLPAIATPQPIQAQASLLLHFDGANGSTAFTDSSQNALTVTAYGDAEISTAESKWGGASGFFDGDTAYLSTPATAALDISSSDFTMECWVYPVSLGGNVPQAIFHNSADDYKGLVIGAQMFGNAYSFDLLMGDNWAVQVPGDNALVNNQWQHVAAVRFGDEYRLFVNGVIVASGTNSYDAPSFDEDAYIGRFRPTQALAWDGYIDDFRIVKGLAVYTSNFTPPTGPLGATVTPQ